MEQVTWWFLTLIVPAIALLTYWFIARRQVRRATEDLERRLEEEKRATARVSHRLRNPLTVIYGFSEALMDADLGDTEEVRSIVTILSAEALDVSRTVEDLVAASDMDRGELRVRSTAFDPSTEIDRAVMPFRRLGSTVLIESWSGTAVTDPIRFRQVIQNLVSNAVVHGGSEISVVADIDGEEFHCTVADDGDGLPPEIRSRLFGSASSHDEEGHVRDSGEVAQDVGDDWERVPDHEGSGRHEATRGEPDGGAGLGLGLSVARAVAASLGGVVTYERLSDITMFTLRLPTEGWPEPLVPLAAKAQNEPGESHESARDEAESEAHRNDAVDAPRLEEPTIAFDPASDVGDSRAEEDGKLDSESDGGDVSGDAAAVEAGSPS